MPASFIHSKMFSGAGQRDDGEVSVGCEDRVFRDEQGMPVKPRDELIEKRERGLSFS